jgi:hypothetical protein
MDPEQPCRRLGVSKIAWRGTLDVLHKLAEELL